MIQIIPSIIVRSKEELRKKFDLVRSEVEWVQVDVMDGVFLTEKTWPYSGGSSGDIRELKGNLKVEAHLMIAKPELHIKEWAVSGVDRILVHHESTGELGVIIDALRDTGIPWGIALKFDTPIEVIDEWAGECDFVQLMSVVEIGYHGKPFEVDVIPKAYALRLKYPELTIQVDGGMTIENALRLAEVGVNGVVVGGAIFNAQDPIQALREFKTTIHE